MEKLSKQTDKIWPEYTKAVQSAFNSNRNLPLKYARQENNANVDYGESCTDLFTDCIHAQKFNWNAPSGR